MPNGTVVHGFCWRQRCHRCFWCKENQQRTRMERPPRPRRSDVRPPAPRALPPPPPRPPPPPPAPRVLLPGGCGLLLLLPAEAGRGGGSIGIAATTGSSPRPGRFLVFPECAPGSAVHQPFIQEQGHQKTRQEQTPLMEEETATPGQTRSKQSCEKEEPQDGRRRRPKREHPSASPVPVSRQA